MSPLVFIPPAQGARAVRHVDLATLASLFAEAEEPTSRASPSLSRTARLATIVLILIGLVGDMVLVARPKLLADVFATRHVDAYASQQA